MIRIVAIRLLQCHSTRCSPVPLLLVKQPYAYYHMTPQFQKYFYPKSKNKKIDYSQVPILDEKDLQEQFVRGGGPGGAKVNSQSNCIVLKHKPTGIVVKCHATRSASQNRKEARRLMVERLDERINGENSVENQMKQLDEKKSSTTSWKRKRLDEMKKKWKEREDLD